MTFVIPGNPDSSSLELQIDGKRSCEKTDETQCLELITKVRRAGEGASPLS